MFDAPMLCRTLKIPFTYCWSPALIPKPVDWPSHIGLIYPPGGSFQMVANTRVRCLWVFLPRRPEILSPSRPCPVPRCWSPAGLYWIRQYCVGRSGKDDEGHPGRCPGCWDSRYYFERLVGPRRSETPRRVLDRRLPPRVVIPTRRCRGSPWRCRHYRLRLEECEANRHRTIFWRVSWFPPL